ncbi:MAG: recombinase family protein [Sulfolobales archaeon]
MVRREIRAVIYARVSSHKQKTDSNLERQVERLRSYCSAKGYRVVDVVTDVSRGLNERCEGFQKLLNMAVKLSMRWMWWWSSATGWLDSDSNTSPASSSRTALE